MKGKISKITEGVFKKERSIGYEKFTFLSLKNSISSKIFEVKIIIKKRKKILSNEIEYKDNKNLIYVFIYLTLIF